MSIHLLRYITTKLLIALVTLLGASVVIFVAMRLVPGGFEQVVLGPLATPESRELITEKYALDRPLVEQYIFWIGSVIQGDFGVSMVTQGSVSQELLRRAPVTIQIALMSLLIALFIGLPLGVMSGVVTNRHQWLRHASRFVGALGASVPDFVLGSIFLYVFTAWPLVLTIGGYVPFFVDPINNLKAMILPSVTLSVFGMALILRTTRDSVKTVMTEGHIGFAVACGKKKSDVIKHHVLRNASIPVITVTGSYLGFLLGGAIIVEVLFSIPGIGLYTYDGLMNRDYAIVQAGALLAATVYITINMLADMVYVLIDPRMAG